MPPLLPLLRDQRQVDAGHLKLLAIFHFVRAGFSLIGLGFIVLHFAIMHTLFSNPEFFANAHNPPPPEFFKLFTGIMKVFYVIAGGFIVASFAANLAAGFCLLKRQARVFSLIVAGLNCLSIPLGTTLGVFTIVVLCRNSVRELYDAGR